MTIPFKINAQPDDITCGPTCLHALYHHLGYDISLDEVIQSVKQLDEGGTLAVLLGIDALKKGFKAKLYSYNLKIFDPSWSTLSSEALIQKLEAQLLHKKGLKFTMASRAYIEFLKCGGTLCFENLTTDLILRYLKNNTPILTGLSATFLYQTPREYSTKKDVTIYDDIKGEPSGHFVVLYGVSENQIYVADPYHGNPFTVDHYYKVNADRLVSAILLGIITYDANLLILNPA